MEDLHITEPPKVECNEIPRNKLIRRFYNVLKQNNFDTNILCSNAKDLDMFFVDKIRTDAVGGYNTFTNEIMMVKNRHFMDYITHEFFHMSSTVRDDKKIYCGLMQQNADVGIGIGLTEGYTQLLNERYFEDITPTKKEHDVIVYPVTKKIAGWVEDIVGREFMEDCYIRADLDKLTMKLCEYVDDYKVLQFLRDLDIYYLEGEEKVLGNLPKAMKAYSNCLLFILECGYYSLDKRYMNNEMTTDEYITILEGLQKLQMIRLHVGLYGTFASIPLDDEYYKKLKSKVRSRLI
jgi:hypothetical protein